MGSAGLVVSKQLRQVSSTPRAAGELRTPS